MLTELAKEDNMRIREHRDLEDWLGEVVWIVGEFINYKNDWYERVCAKLETRKVKTVAQRHQARGTLTIYQGIMNECSELVSQIDDCVAEINKVPSGTELRRLIRKIYAIIYSDMDLDRVLESDF